MNIYHDEDAICKSLADQEKRMKDTGWSHPMAVSTKTIWSDLTSDDEKNRFI